jgi:cold shock CspA family protein
MKELLLARGTIVKVVRTFGSRWGRIRPANELREVFFNTASLTTAVEFSALEIGQEVEFDEQGSQVNGSYAEHVVLLAAETEQIPA